MDKSPDAFRTISEVADVLDTPAHVLRFWESRFPQIRPVKRAGGRRYYRPSDVALLTGIKRLLHDEGLTIRGVQKILRDHGVRHVAGLSDETVGVEDVLKAGIPVLQVTAPTGEETGIEAAADDTADRADTSPVGRTGTVAPKTDAVVIRPPLSAQPPLPLFDAVIAPHAPTQHTSLQPARRDDQTPAALIRALPHGLPAARRAALLQVARHLAALRATLAERAEGGAG